MSRIVIDAREYTTSTGRYISNLIQYLQDIDSEHSYVILLKPKDMDSCNIHNPRFTKVECPFKEFSFSEQLGYFTQLKNLNADLVHFGKTEQPISYKGLKVTTIHDLTTMRFKNPSKQPLIYWCKQQVYKYVIKNVTKNSAAIFVPTEYVKADLINFTNVTPHKVHVTLESADQITEPPAPLKNLQNRKYIMYIGRPTPHKNLPRLIEAFGRLRAHEPDLILVLAGKKDANYDRIESDTPEHIRQHICFTGYISEGQLRWLYEHCAAYVFPSLSEGFGLPGLEAMRHGAPVVSSNATCLPELYGTAAHYFDPLQVDEMTDAILEVLSDKHLRSELIHKGKEQVQKYSWKRMATQTLAVYDELLRSQ